MISRDFANLVRFIMDNALPPLVRDSRVFMFPFFCIAYGFKSASRAMKFKDMAVDMSDIEYLTYYEDLNSISRRRNTDLNKRCVQRILEEVDATESILDVGCGSGYLVQLMSRTGSPNSVVGCDVVSKCAQDFRYVQCGITALPFADECFEVVVSSHVLEHVIDLNASLKELCRVVRRKLIIVVPCQRYYRYTLDEHLSFFPSRDQLILQMGLWKMPDYKIWHERGDWLIVVEKPSTAADCHQTGNQHSL